MYAIRSYYVLLLSIKDEVQVSGINNLLPMQLLLKLNASLSMPIEILLKRPQQKSYPHINGLYLLLRATALGLIIAKGKNNILRLNDVITSYSIHYTKLYEYL